MNVDIFEKKQFSLLFSIVYRVSFISHLHAFLVSVCTKGFAYLLCRPRGRGLGLLVCKRRFSFREIYNFLLFNFFLPSTFTHTHDLYPLRTHEPRHYKQHSSNTGLYWQLLPFHLKVSFLHFFVLQDMSRFRPCHELPHNLADFTTVADFTAGNRRHYCKVISIFKWSRNIVIRNF